MSTDPRYPIGKFRPQKSYTEEEIIANIDEVEALPARLTEVVDKLTEDQLDTPYRAGGWTNRQLIHHIVDSHLNSYIRFKWTLTEENPTIKAYDQDGWASLPDSDTDIQVSLVMLKSLHERWVRLLRSLRTQDWKKTYVHPESESEINLERTVALYAWHGEHHLHHILNFLKGQ